MAFRQGATLTITGQLGRAAAGGWSRHGCCDEVPTASVAAPGYWARLGAQQHQQHGGSRAGPRRRSLRAALTLAYGVPGGPGACAGPSQTIYKRMRARQLTVAPGATGAGAEMVERYSSGKKSNELTFETTGLMQSCSGRVSRAAWLAPSSSTSTTPATRRAIVPVMAAARSHKSFDHL